MRSFTLLLQVAAVAFIAPSWGFPQGGLKLHKGLIRPQVASYADNDYFLAQQSTTEKPLRIIAAEQRPSESREEFLIRKRLQEEELRRQAESAKYSFASSLSDRLMDGEHIRSETREGLKTTGSYTYSDGYVRRTVEYEADENGYRVVKQTEEQIGDGPQPDPTGGADVAAYYDRSKLQYSITADDIRGHYTGEEEEEEELTTKFPFLAAFQRNLGPKPTTPAPVPITVPTPAPVPIPIQTPKVVLSNNYDTEQLYRQDERLDIQTPQLLRQAERHDIQTPQILRQTERHDIQTPHILRQAERHDIQTPLRPSPHLRGQYFTQVHSL